MRKEGGRGGCGEGSLVGVVKGEGGPGSGDADERAGVFVGVALCDSTEAALGGGVFS